MVTHPWLLCRQRWLRPGDRRHGAISPNSITDSLPGEGALYGNAHYYHARDKRQEKGKHSSESPWPQCRGQRPAQARRLIVYFGGMSICFQRLLAFCYTLLGRCSLNSLPKGAAIWEISCKMFLHNATQSQVSLPCATSTAACLSL